jgi:RNA polymerase sigma factor (sigma-70 family)
MPNSHPVNVGPPDPGDSPPSGSVASPAKCPEIDRDPCENNKAFLDWRARRLDDDPDLTDAWTWFYRDFTPLLRAAVDGSRTNLLEPEDATQEAWLVLISRFLIDSDGGASDELSAWMVVVIRNRLADLERRAGRRRSEPLGDDEADSLAGREEDPATGYERHRVQEVVRLVLEEARHRVSGPSHRIIVLRWIEGRTFAEIGEILGMPVARVRDRHRRAIPTLRDLLILRFGSDPAVPWAANLDADDPELDLEEVTP